MSKSTKIGSNRTCALAVYTHDHAVIRAVAATVGVLPAEIVSRAVTAWLERQEPALQGVVEAVEQRLTREKES